MPRRISAASGVFRGILFCGILAWGIASDRPGHGPVANAASPAHLLGNDPIQNDIEYMTIATADALESLPTGKAETWNNSSTGSSGKITLTKTYQTAGGAYCREFVETLFIGNIGGANGQKVSCAACRVGDKIWKLITACNFRASSTGTGSQQPSQTAQPKASPPSQQGSAAKPGASIDTTLKNEGQQAIETLVKKLFGGTN